MCSLSQLAEGDHAAGLALLRLFAYGTWPEYEASPAKYGHDLSYIQRKKLKALSVASMASLQRTLHYNHLMEQLNFSTIRALEDFLISECIYPGLVKGRLDQEAKCMHVTECRPRDVRPGALADIISALEGWLQNADSVLKGTQLHTEYISSATKAAESRLDHRAAAFEAARGAVQAEVDAKAQMEGVSMEEADVVALMIGGDCNGGPSEGPKSAGARVSKRRR